MIVHRVYQGQIVVKPDDPFVPLKCIGLGMFRRLEKREPHHYRLIRIKLTDEVMTEREVDSCRTVRRESILDRLTGVNRGYKIDVRVGD